MSNITPKCSKCGVNNIDTAKYCSNCGTELLQSEEETRDAILKQRKKENYRKILGTIVSIVTFYLVYFAVQQLFFKTPSFEKAMRKEINEINKSCPITIDNDTRLDNVMLLSNRIIQYHYTLVNFEKQSIDTVEMKKYMEPNIINFVRTTPDLKFQRDNKATINYFYRDKNGNYLCVISVTPKQYK